MSTWSETVAVTGDVREEVVKHVMLIVPHSFEQSVIGVLGKLLCSRISHAIEAKPDPSAGRRMNASMRCLSGVEAYPHHDVSGEDKNLVLIRLGH